MLLYLLLGFIAGILFTILSRLNKILLEIESWKKCQVELPKNR